MTRVWLRMTRAKKKHSAKVSLNVATYDARKYEKRSRRKAELAKTAKNDRKNAESRVISKKMAILVQKTLYRIEGKD